MLLLAALLNGDRMSAFNAAGLVFCLLGILLHILFKYRQSGVVVVVVVGGLVGMVCCWCGGDVCFVGVVVGMLVLL